MWCYRRFGHNEGDEPSFTQPLMYAAIKKHPPISQSMAQRLIDEGMIDQKWIDEATSSFTQHLEYRVRDEHGRQLPAEQGTTRFSGRWGKGGVGSRREYCPVNPF